MRPRTPVQVRGVLTRKGWHPGVIFHEGARDCRKPDADLIRRSLPLLRKCKWAGKDVRTLVAAVDGRVEDNSVTATWVRTIDTLRALFATAPVGPRKEREKLLGFARDEVVVKAMLAALSPNEEVDPSWLAVFSAHGTRAAKAVVRKQMRGLSEHPRLVQAISSFENSKPARRAASTTASHGPLPAKMRRTDFWSLIDGARDATDAAGTLGDWLRGLSPDQVVAFDHHFSATMERAYRYDLWGAASLLLGGCSDDNFSDFRAELILRGRKVFERVLRRPDSLVDHPDVEGDEGIADLANTVYKEMTGDEMPQGIESKPTRPTGRKFSFSRRSLEKRYPRIAAVVQEG